MAHNYLLSPHPTGTMLNPGFSGMSVDFTSMHKIHDFIGLPLTCLDVLLPIPTPSKLTHCHLTSLTYLFILLNHGSFSLPLAICRRLPMGLQLSSLPLFLVTLCLSLPLKDTFEIQKTPFSCVGKPNSPDLLWISKNNCGNQKLNTDIFIKHFCCDHPNSLRNLAASN